MNSTLPYSEIQSLAVGSSYIMKIFTHEFVSAWGRSLRAVVRQSLEFVLGILLAAARGALLPWSFIFGRSVLLYGIRK